MKDLVEFIAKKLVQNPEDVQVRVIERDDNSLYELRVHQEDMGRIIGRNGKTAKAFRTVVGAAAAKADVYVTLEIIE